VRIFANATGDTNGDANSASKYRLGFVEGPDEGDVIGKAEGTTYYVAPEVAPSLHDVVLDVAESGRLVCRWPRYPPKNCASS
jgi:Fe-S cluster assembly iron-binding protein IscA